MNHAPDPPPDDLRHIHYGRKYRIEKTRGLKLFMKCSNREKHFCGGRGNLNLMTDEFIETKPHTCSLDPFLQECEDFRNDLKYDSMYTSEKFKKIYDRRRMQYPNASVRYPYYTMKGSMVGWRQATNPPNPRSLDHFAELLNSEPWSGRLWYLLGTEEQRLKAVRVQAGNRTALVFINEELLRSFGDSPELVVDGTFQTTPSIPGAVQILTILVERYGKMFVVGYAIMEDKKTDSYVAVMRVFAPYLRNIKKVLADYETGLRNAAKIVWPAAIFQGCHAHYLRAINRKIFRIVPQNGWTHELEDLRRRIIALPLLPAEKIIEGFQEIQRRCSHHARAVLQPFFLYYIDEWLCKVTPENFSVYDADRRTTNDAESHNNILRDNLENHPTAWEFLRRLLIIVAATQLDLLTMQRGGRVDRVRSLKFIIKEKLLKDAWARWKTGTVPLWDQLETFGYLHEEAIRELDKQFEKYPNNPRINSYDAPNPEPFANADQAVKSRLELQRNVPVQNRRLAEPQHNVPELVPEVENQNIANEPSQVQELVPQIVDPILNDDDELEAIDLTGDNEEQASGLNNEQLVAVPSGSSQNSIVVNKDVQLFIRWYDQEFGTTHPVFYPGSFSEAKSKARHEQKVLLVYLHDRNSRLANQYCRDAFAGVRIIKFVNENTLFWACDLQSDEGRQVGEILECDDSIFFAVIAMLDNRMKILGCLEGERHNNALLSWLRERTAAGNAEFMQVRQLRADRNARQNAQHQQQQGDPDDGRARSLDRQPPLPQSGRCFVQVEMPYGLRCKSFLLADTIKNVRKWIRKQPRCPTHFELWTGCPRTLVYPDPLNRDPQNVTLLASGFGTRQTLFVKDLDM